MKRRLKTTRATAGLVGLVAISILPVHAALGQQTGKAATDDPDFGDIFVHPRDKAYLPGKAPSRAVFDTTIKFEDVRGQVNRYEYNKGSTFIARETWVDDRGETQARIGIGKKF